MSAALRRMLRGPKAGMLGENGPEGGTDEKRRRRRRTQLSAKQLEHFRELLVQRRAELVGNVLSLETGALRGAGEDSTHKAFHPDDLGAETFEQDFTLQLAASERQMLEEIDEALKRIDEGTYGICEATGQPIRLARLEAKPWARLCIEAARERESQPSQRPSST